MLSTGRCKRLSKCGRLRPGRRGKFSMSSVGTGKHGRPGTGRHGGLRDKKRGQSRR